MWMEVFEFLPLGHYLQLSSVSTAWRALYASTMQRRGLAQAQKETAAGAMITSVPLIQWAVANGCKETLGLLYSAAQRSPLEVVQYLHAQRMRGGIDPSHNVYLCEDAARRGDLEMLRWARANGFNWDINASAAAARSGHLEVLQWVHANGCELNSRTCSAAARGGQLQALQWARDAGCGWDEKTCSSAAAGGHLEVLQWARGAGCGWDEETCNSAAAGGHLDILQYARSHGCPWSSETSYHAVRHGHLQLLQWAHANGCPARYDAYSTAAGAGHSHVLEWLHATRRPWDPYACSAAALNGHLDVLQWLRARGWNGEDPLLFLRWSAYTIGDHRTDRVVSTVEWALADGCPCRDETRSAYTRLQREVRAVQARGTEAR